MEGRTTSKAGMDIDRASAGNVRRTKEEIADDPEEEDQFGYTASKSPLHINNCTLSLSLEIKILIIKITQKKRARET